MATVNVFLNPYMIEGILAGGGTHEKTLHRSVSDYISFSDHHCMRGRGAYSHPDYKVSPNTNTHHEINTNVGAANEDSHADANGYAYTKSQADSHTRCYSFSNANSLSLHYTNSKQIYTDSDAGAGQDQISYADPRLDTNSHADTNSYFLAFGGSSPLALQD